MSAVPIVKPVDYLDGPMLIDEYIKLITLLMVPNPQMRRALKFYTPPDGLQDVNTPWGQLLKELRHYECQQDPGEVAQVMELIQGKHSFLEIGSAFGGTLKRFASVLAPKSNIVSVDIPDKTQPMALNPRASLEEACKSINLSMGHCVNLFIGDSHSSQTVEAVRNFAPFDFAFIDGDHSYEGVKADWENYGPMCKTVGFHDIAGPVVGCSMLWDEIVAKKEFATKEFINTHDKYSGLGIGVVFRESAP